MVLHSIRKLRRRSRIAIATGGVALLAFGVAFGASSAGASSSCIKMLLEFKLQGLAVFQANTTGVNNVAAAYGICHPVKYSGPAAASATGQVADIQAATAAHVKVIALTSDDPTVPAPALKAAM